MARCYDNVDKTEYRPLVSRWETVTALKKTPAGADAVTGGAAASGPVAIRLEHANDVPTGLLLQRR